MRPVALRQEPTIEVPERTEKESREAQGRQRRTNGDSGVSLSARRSRRKVHRADHPRVGATSPVPPPARSRRGLRRAKPRTPSSTSWPDCRLCTSRRMHSFTDGHTKALARAAQIPRPDANKRSSSNARRVYETCSFSQQSAPGRCSCTHVHADMTSLSHTACMNFERLHDQFGLSCACANACAAAAAMAQTATRSSL